MPPDALGDHRIGQALLDPDPDLFAFGDRQATASLSLLWHDATFTADVAIKGG